MHQELSSRHRPPLRSPVDRKERRSTGPDATSHRAVKSRWKDRMTEVSPALPTLIGRVWQVIGTTPVALAQGSRQAPAARAGAGSAGMMGHAARCDGETIRIFGSNESRREPIAAALGLESGEPGPPNRARVLMKQIRRSRRFYAAGARGSPLSRSSGGRAVDPRAAPTSAHLSPRHLSPCGSGHSASSSGAEAIDQECPPGSQSRSRLG